MNTPFALAAPRLFDGEVWHENTALVIAGGEVAQRLPVAELPDHMEVTRLETGLLAPGLVDVQINGGGGVLFNNDPSLEGVKTICAANVSLGSTALLPTLITDTNAVRDRAIAAGIAAYKIKVPGFAGLHLEGPHLSLARKGAHDQKLIRPMDETDIGVLVEARKSLPVLVTTIAAESVTPAQVRTLTQGGVIVSIGHCDAGSEAVQALLSAGASMFTHLFNAMSQLSGREPGMVGAALNSAKAHIGLIADGYHVHPATMALALRAKKAPGRIFLVSDAMSFGGTSEKELVLNGRKILRTGGRLTLEDGTLAGADLDLPTAIGVIHNQVKIDLGEALRMASLYPARAVGLKDAGKLVPGMPANIVWLGEGLQPLDTWIGGVKTPEFPPGNQ